MSAKLVCAACGEVLPALSRRSSCPCGGLLDVVQRPREPGRTLRARFDRRLRQGDPAGGSPGNTAAVRAASAAQAGLKALVFVPAGQVAAGKLAQALAYGARTLLV